MRISSIPENLFEWMALKVDIASTPILATMVALLLAKTIIAGTE